jgi:hypothetical protein
MALTYGESVRKAWGGGFVTITEVTFDTSYPENGYALNLSKLLLQGDEEWIGGWSTEAFKTSTKELLVCRITSAVLEPKIQLFRAGTASNPLVELPNATSAENYKTQVFALGR